MTTKILAYLIKYAIKNYMFVLGINRLLLQTDIKALRLSKTQKILCTSLAHVHEHKDTFEKLSTLHKIYTIRVSVSFPKYL